MLGLWPVGARAAWLVLTLASMAGSGSSDVNAALLKSPGTFDDKTFDDKTFDHKTFARALVPMTAEERILAAVRAFGEHAVLISSMQKTAAILMHLFHRLGLSNEVLFVDTGYHFPETLSYRDELQERFRLNLLTLTPKQTVQEQEATYGCELYRFVDGQKRCCSLRKEEPYIEHLRQRGHRLTMVGLRAQEGGHRSKVTPMQRDPRFGGYTMHPLFDWTDEDVAQYLQRYDVPAHPLHARGYPSIGCAPCTTPIVEGEHPRAGRWRHLRQADGEQPLYCNITAVDREATKVNSAPKEDLYVIVPCFNEEDNVEATVADIEANRAHLPVNVKIILADDGSTDQTAEKMRALAASHDNIKVRINGRNLGIGATVMAATADIPDEAWVTVVPGDNDFMFSSIERFLSLRDRYDLILGYIQNEVVRPLRRRLGAQLFAVSVRTVYGLPFRYVNGMKLYKAEVFRGIDVAASGHAHNAELIAKALLRNPFLRVTEVPFGLRGRRAGESRSLSLRTATQVLGGFAVGRRAVSEYRRTVLGLRD